ncbi:MAG: hypothetical protein J0M00_03020 [Burkholderiales bacterium]|nr:hypothetical protein [Burkholderiales bacterium]
MTALAPGIRIERMQLSRSASQRCAAFNLDISAKGNSLLARMNKMSEAMRILVKDSADCFGSHLRNEFVAVGDDVHCADGFSIGRRRTVEDLLFSLRSS